MLEMERYETLLLAASTSTVVVTLGSLNHFWFDLSDKHSATKWFAASDESVFQHMKLVFWPWMATWIVATVYYWKFRGMTPSLSSIAFGLLMTNAFIPAGFFLYTDGFKSKHMLWLDILLFIESVVLGCIYTSVFLFVKVDKTFDLVNGTIVLVSMLTWILTCSYVECKDIYRVY